METECGAIVGRPPSRGSSLPIKEMPPCTPGTVSAAAPLPKDNMVTFSTQSTLQKCNSSIVIELQNAAIPTAKKPLEEMDVKDWRFSWVTHAEMRHFIKTRFIKKMRDEFEKVERKFVKDQKKALELQNKPQASKSAPPPDQSNCCMMTMFHDVKRSKDDVGWWLCQSCFLWMCSSCAVDFKERHMNYHAISAQARKVAAAHATTSHESAVAAGSLDAPIIPSILHNESTSASVLPSIDKLPSKARGPYKPRSKKPGPAEASSL
jgi:hypothetical protein